MDLDRLNGKVHLGLKGPLREVIYFKFKGRKAQESTLDSKGRTRTRLQTTGK